MEFSCCYLKRYFTNPPSCHTEPVLFAQGNRTNAVFDRVIVDGQITGFGIARERGPAFQAVIDGFGGGAVWRGMESGLLQPVVQG